MTIFTINPSINKYSCGWCTLSKDEKVFKFGLINGYGDSWIQKAIKIGNKLCVLIDENKNVNKVIIELPEYWSGIVNRTRNSASLFKLFYLCGYIHGKINNIEIVTPSIWKGQLSKEEVQRRLQRHFGKRIKNAIDHNVLDAVGIAYSYYNEWEVL